MDTIERDFLYDQKIDDINVKLELLILEAFSSVLDQLMASCRNKEGNSSNDDVDWPF